MCAYSFPPPQLQEQLWRHTDVLDSPAVMFLFNPNVTFLELDNCSLFSYKAK